MNIAEEETQVEEDTYEEQAKEMGLVPEDQFHGAKEKWRPAKEFVERGEHILPLLQANNKKLKQELLTRDGKIATLQKSVEASEKAIANLQRTYNETTKLQVEAAKKGVLEQLRAAKVSGDVDAELALQEELADLRKAQSEAKTADEQVVTAAKEVPQLHPDFIEWNRENLWFGNADDADDRKRTKALIRIGEDFREEGNKDTGRSFMDKCMKVLLQREGAGTKSGSKVEGSSSGERNSSSTSRGYAALPREAKEACANDADMFVGPGKMFKELKGWQDHYASIYNEGN